MLHKTTTLVLLASLAATSAIWASDAQEDLSLRGVLTLSSSTIPQSSDEESLEQSSNSTIIITGLEELEVGNFTLPSSSLSYEELKDYDQNGSRYFGQKVKIFVEEKIPGGKAITTATTTFSKSVLGTETLTEYVVGMARKPLKLSGEYPTTKNGLVGQKAKKLVELIPGGEKVTAITGMLGQKLFGTSTLVEGVLNKLTSTSPKSSEESSKPSDIEVDIEVADEHKDASSSADGS